MPSSAKLTRLLVDVAMGRAHANLVIRNGQWVCVQSGEIIEQTDVAIVNGHIAYVGGNAGHTVGKDTIVVDAHGRYLVPGLLDGHMHVESGMVTVTEFVRAVAPRGTTGMFIDPHEIANVFGIKGVRLMVDEAARQPIHVWVQVPSCVPSSPGFETPGASITAEEVVDALNWQGVIGLGEMMNFPGVAAGDGDMLAEMAAAHAARKTIGGHYASLDLGLPFHGYVAGGAEDDHEGTRLEDAIARARQGMKVMLRYGSAWHDVAAQVKAITTHKLDSRNFILCTDDSHAQTITQEGHMDRVLRHAIAEGLDPMTAIQMCTINTAEHFGLTRELGMIAAGRWADILLVNDLRDFHPEMVIARGQVIAQNGSWTVEPKTFAHPEWAVNSVNLKREIKPEDFKLVVKGNRAQVTAHVIGIQENQAPTRHLKFDMKPEAGGIKVDLKRDIVKVAILERHKGSGAISLGLVNGFGFTKNCAVASTVAHDCHQMVVVGTDDACMAEAANALARSGGGQLVVLDGKVRAQVELQIGGLMSTERAEVVAQKAASVLEAFRECGCTLNNPNMQLSLLALVVIPELRLSDLGLVDVKKIKFIPVLE